MQTKLLPLRTVVGRALPLKSVRLVSHSALLDASQIRIALHTNRQGAEDEALYRYLHPEVWDDAAGSSRLFGTEVRTYRVPADLPVGPPAMFQTTRAQCHYSGD
jgi:hypothetical protein